MITQFRFWLPSHLPSLLILSANAQSFPAQCPKSANHPLVPDSNNPHEPRLPNTAVGCQQISVCYEL